MTDTAAAPVMLIRVPTRERIGGTTFIRYAYGRALAEGRDCDAGDFDRRGQVFRGWFKEQVPAGKFYEGGMRSAGWGTCIVPASGETTHLKADISTCVDGVARTQRSLVLDFAGSEVALAEYARDNSLSAVCEEAKVRLTAVAMVGPDAQDISTVMRLVGYRLFQAHELLLVCNAGVPRDDGRDVDVLDIFQTFMSGPDIAALMKDGAKVMVMPRFQYMADVERAKVDFFRATDPSCPALGIVQRVNTKVWLYGNRVKEKLVKVGMAQQVEASGAGELLP